MQINTQQRKMMQSEPLMPFGQPFNFTDTAFNHHSRPYDEQMNLSSSSFPSPEDSSFLSSNSYIHNMLLDEFFDLENFDDEIHTSPAMEGSIEEFCEWINENENEGNSISCSSQSNQNSVNFPLADVSLVLPMELDDQLGLLHLLRAYGEATENGGRELAEVIVKSINQRSSPMGTTMERVAYNLFLSRENQGKYLREETSKNFAAAFKVFYQTLPNGRFAHFAANSAILESMPQEVETLRIVDFDTGEGVQWSPLIEALSGKIKTLILTSIKQEEVCNCTFSRFEDTKKRLLAHAEECGVEVRIEEKSMEDHCREATGMERREWVVFNCMVGLPHMGRRRSRKQVDEFLNSANEILANFEGIFILGDGDLVGEMGLDSYASYFDDLLRHYEAVFESLEMNFPVYLAEARTAMESVFLAPYLCPFGWFRDWEERREMCERMSLKGRGMRRESLSEVKEMVNERESSYKVKIEGIREHEMVLQWKETTLVRVSTWM